MFCDSCGTPLQAGQVYCVRCGKAIIAPVHPGGNRVARHAQMLGILWIAYSALLAIPGVFVLIFFRTIFPAIMRMQPPHGAPPPEFMLRFMHPLMTFIGIVLLAKAVAGVAAGVGMLQRAPWSRMLTIILACISLISIPFGTALGVYSLWVLLSPNADNEFQGQGRAVAV